MVYGILRFSNFAHGDIMAFGTMVVILFTWLFQSYGINLGPLPTAILALPFGIIATAIFLLGSDKFVYKFYREKKAVPVTYLIASVGIMFVLNGIVRFIIGPNDQRFADGERFIIKAKAMKQYLGTAEGCLVSGVDHVSGNLAGGAAFCPCCRRADIRQQRARDERTPSLFFHLSRGLVGGYPRRNFNKQKK